jgi:hypothetical protein
MARAVGNAGVNLEIHQAMNLWMGRAPPVNQPLSGHDCDAAACDSAYPTQRVIRDAVPSYCRRAGRGHPRPCGLARMDGRGARQDHRAASRIPDDHRGAIEPGAPTGRPSRSDPADTAASRAPRRDPADTTASRAPRRTCQAAGPHAAHGEPCTACSRAASRKRCALAGRAVCACAQCAGTSSACGTGDCDCDCDCNCNCTCNCVGNRAPDARVERPEERIACGLQYREAGLSRSVEAARRERHGNRQICGRPERAH